MKTHNIIVVVRFLFLLGLVILVHIPCTPYTSWALFPWALFTNSLPGVPCSPREQHPDDQSWGLNTNETPWPGPHSPLLSVHLICQAECSGLRLQTRPSSSLASSEPRHCLLFFCFQKLSLVGKQAFSHIAGGNECGTISRRQFASLSKLQLSQSLDPEYLCIWERTDPVLSDSKRLEAIQCCQWRTGLEQRTLC